MATYCRRNEGRSVLNLPYKSTVNNDSAGLTYLDVQLRSQQLTRHTAKIVKVIVYFVKFTKYQKQLLIPFNLLKTKRNLLYIWNQFVPRSKHFLPRL